MRWLVLLLLVGCAVQPSAPLAPSARHSVVRPDPLISEARRASDEATRRTAKLDDADQIDHVTDLKITMRDAVDLARAHPNAKNRRRARAAIKALGAFSNETWSVAHTPHR